MSLTPQDTKIPPGTLLLQKYKVSREIGRGGMAAVYEAEHMALGKRIAVKVLAAELAASTIVIERFFREARAAASVKSPHIVDVYDSGRLEDGRPFIAMELLEGESLYDRMARIRIIDIKTTVRVIMHCAKGLTKAHAAGVIHRDLKPENIFLVANEEGEEVAKILDFGLAKFYSPVNPDEQTKRLTREGAVFGTPAYMSPEQVKGQGSVDQRADLWALGCMTFECLIGRPVWNTDQGVAMTFAAIATAPIPMPSKIRSDLPPSFDEWFKKALARDPNQRFQTAKELADALVQSFAPSARASIASTSGEGEALLALDSFGQVSSANIQLIDSTNMSAARVSDPNSVSALLQQSASLHGPLLEAPASIPASTPPARKVSTTRYAVSLLLLAASIGAACGVWVKYLRPQVLTPIVMSTASAEPSASQASSAQPAQPTEGDPKWASVLGEGQKAFAAGDFVDAQKKFKDAQDLGAGAVARAFADQSKVAQTSTGACKMVALSHPRLGIGGNIGRPTISANAHGVVVAWTDDHEQAGHEHAYSVMIDPAGRPTSRPRDLTPEANDVARPSLFTNASGDRIGLLYWDKSGREAGVRARWLDGDGRIAGASILVGGGHPGNYWPALDATPDGYFVAWIDDRDREGDDLFLRKLSVDLEPIGPELRATDYAPIARGKWPNVRTPSVAVAGNALYVVYRLDRDGHPIVRMRLPLTAPQLAKGLDERAPGNDAAKRDHELGEVKVIDEDKVAGDAPQITCGREGCFVVWHGEQGGAFAALVDPAQGRAVWHKKFAATGSHPALGVNADGQIVVAYIDGGRIHIAPISRDGVGTPSTIAKITPAGDQPRAWITGGPNKGEWYIAWQDFEAGHSEPYAARVVCK